MGRFFGMGPEERSAATERGSSTAKRFLPIGITVDERVCPGAHYARFFKDFKHCLNRPERLEPPPDEARFDQGCEYHEPKPNAPLKESPSAAI